MNLEQCQSQLREQFKWDFSQEDNISALMKNAWWDQKTVCMHEMWWITGVQKFLTRIKKTKQLPKVSVEETKEWTEIVNAIEQQEPAKETYESSEGFMGQPLAIAKEYGGYAIKIVIALIAIYFTWKMIRSILTFLYDMVNINRVRYLKIMVPRGEWKSDREQAKEIAKDMKEKIGRMSQVFNNLHKLWELNMRDNFMRVVFRKPKMTLICQYEKGLIYFIIGVYPEYQKIVESSISSQYSNSSIEIIKRPHMMKKKHSYVMPMEPIKEPAYTIKMYKTMPDDPINNLINAIAKIPLQDTFSIVLPIKPVGESGFNKRAKIVANALFKKDEESISKTPFWKYLIFPWKVIEFFIYGPSKALLESHNKEKKWDAIVRMLKSQEESINAMWEEAANPAFTSWLLLVTSTDEKLRCRENMNLVVSAFNVYGDQYTNELDNPEKIADMFHFILQPLRKLALRLRLPGFFYRKNIFTINELASLYHFPDAAYNRSNIIEWMQYKVLPGPNNLPVMTEFNGFIMSGVVAESYKSWKLSDILVDYKKHRAVGEKIVKKDKLEPVHKFSKKQLMDKEIVEKDGKQMVKVQYDKKVWGYKLSRQWVLLGINIYKNRYEPVFMKRDDRTRHHYCIGKSGTGKSVYMQSLVRQDIWNGDGVCVIDPHGDLVEDILKYIPKERAKDVIYFNAWDEDRPMGLNLYEIDTVDEADRTVNDATEIFIKMFWSEIFGPRIQEYFKFGSLTLLEDLEDRPTLLDVPRLFTDDTYREFKTKDVQNPVVRNFREKTYNAMGDREKKEIIPYFTSKFVSFNTNRLIRNIIGQTKSAFKLDDVMNNQKILLISLSKGRIGDMNAQLLGMILVSKIYTAAMARAKIPQNERKDFYLYVDEFQNFVSATFADILSEARKYRLCLIMAHQYIKQLESGKQEWGKWDVKAAVFGNVWTMQSFKVGAPDAEFLEKEYSPSLSQQDIIGIANYKAYIKLNISNSTSRPFSMNAIYTQDYENEKIAGILKEYCAKKYGRKREFVDAEMAARLGLWVEELDELGDGKTDLEWAQAKSKEKWTVVQAPEEGN